MACPRASWAPREKPGGEQFFCDASFVIDVVLVLNVLVGDRDERLEAGENFRVILLRKFERAGCDGGQN
jgi:hypothetical protein